LKRLIVITGATACGKTSISVKIAKHLNTEIISCDSRQFYTEMAIGTAKPTIEEMDGVVHHFVDSHSVTAQINAGQFERLTLELLQKLFKKNDQIILTGGSGLFIDAVVNGFDDMPPIPKELRDRLNNELQENGIQPLIKQLQKLDPDYAKTMDIHNPKRIVRGLEVCLSGAKTFSELRTGQLAKRPFEVIKFVIDRPRAELYERINSRVDIMFELGLEKEARSLLQYRDLSSLQTVGYRELFDYFDGATSLERATELIKQNSRRYAKRQLTWFRRDENYIWVNANEPEAILNKL
jgi:tRNA dimethylallyltransferase